MRENMFKVNDTLASSVDFVEILLKESSLRAVYEGLEARGLVGRLDQTISPTVFRGALVTAGEMQQLREVEKVVRLGRVKAVHAQHVEMERGQLRLETDTLLVDCTASGLGGCHGSYHVFSPHHIRLSMSLALFNTSHSSSCIAHLEATFESDAEKNAISDPATMSYPRLAGELAEFIHMLYADLKTRDLFSKHWKSAMFRMNARTDAPSRKHCSLASLLWTAFGPKRLFVKMRQAVSKLESIGYDDVPPHKVPGCSESI